jgi:hypothetical protein
MSLRRSRLWAITTMFDSANAEQRWRNFRIFRERLNVPLMVVELAFEGAPLRLRPGDADIVIQLAGGDVMWQKERLLNIGFAQLPDTCEAVAWLDADVIFEEDQWAAWSMDALNVVEVLQPFSQAHYQRRGAAISFSPQDAERSVYPRSSQNSGEATQQQLWDEVAACGGKWAMGLAWVARREILCHGLYDANIVGGGDSAFFFAVHNAPDALIEMHSMTGPRCQHYRSYCEKIAALRPRVGFVEGKLLHLWHGSFERRQARERHEKLNEFQFDPSTDLRLSTEGVWQWASEKPAMHRYLRAYFAGRAEED